MDGEDFAASGSLTFKFQMGAEGNKSCIDIDIMNDMNFEGDHSFEVTLGPNMPTLRGGTGGFGSSTSTTIIIQDYKGMFVIDGYDVLCNFGCKDCSCIASTLMSSQIKPCRELASYSGS